MNRRSSPGLRRFFIGPTMTKPNPKDVAEQLISSMLAPAKPDPIGWATARDEQGRPLYMLVCVMGRENIESMESSLNKLKPHMKPVDTFE